MDNKKLNLIMSVVERLPEDGSELTRKDVADIIPEWQWKSCYKWLVENAADYITANKSHISVKDVYMKKTLIRHINSIREQELRKTKYYRISKVSEMLDIPQATLRFWESIFPQLKPNRGGGAHRWYTLEDIEVCKLIKHLLRDKGLSLEYAKKSMEAYRKISPGDDLACTTAEKAIELLNEVAKISNSEHAEARIDAVIEYLRRQLKNDPA